MVPLQEDVLISFNLLLFFNIIPSFCLSAKPLRGSISVIQSIRVPPVAFPEKEDVILPPVLKEQKHKWTPFGCGRHIIDIYANLFNITEFSGKASQKVGGKGDSQDFTGLN